MSKQDGTEQLLAMLLHGAPDRVLEAVVTPSADDMTGHDWNYPEGRFLSYVLGPDGSSAEPLFVVLNSAPEAIDFTMPKLPEYRNWTNVLNTTNPHAAGTFASGTTLQAAPRSVLAFAGAA